MDALQALILGIVQGLTEYLPVSSSGHLQLGNELLGIHTKDNLLFSVIVHAATALASVIIFRKDIVSILKGLLQFKWNEETRYATLIVLSMIPVALVGIFLKDELKVLFEGNITLVGSMLIVTAGLLFLTLTIKKHDKNVDFPRATGIGIAQAIAVLPGISRSGSTIAVALLMGVDKAKAAKFSFLMVIAPILGEAVLDLKDISGHPEDLQISTTSLLIGFIAAFIVGLVACKIMLEVVRRGKIHYFGFYCLIAGTIAVLAGMHVFGN